MSSCDVLYIAIRYRRLFFSFYFVSPVAFAFSTGIAKLINKRRGIKTIRKEQKINQPFSNPLRAPKAVTIRTMYTIYVCMHSMYIFIGFSGNKKKKREGKGRKEFIIESCFKEMDLSMQVRCLLWRGWVRSKRRRCFVDRDEEG